MRRNETHTFQIMEEDVIVTLEEQAFNGNVREWIVSIYLYVVRACYLNTCDQAANVHIISTATADSDEVVC